MKYFFFGMVLSLLLLFFSALTSFAARPLTADDAWTVEKGRFQLEMGMDVLRQDNHDREAAPSLTVRYGFLEKMDTGVGSSYLWVHPAEGKNKDGIGDLELDLKYRLLEDKGWFPAFALKGALKIPTASESRGLGSGKTDFGILTLFTKSLSKRLAVHFNLGYTFTGGHGAPDDFRYSGSMQWILSDQWSLVGEVVGINNFNGRKGDDPISGLIGTNFTIRENLVLDAGVEIGMSRAAPDFRGTTGLTFLFKP